MANPEGIGGFAAGQSGNPLGARSPGAKLNARLDYWLHERSVGELKALVMNTEEWDNLPSIDGLLARRLHTAVQEAGETKDFVAILEFYAGKPKQALTGGDFDDAPIRLLTNSDADIIARYQQISSPEKNK